MVNINIHQQLANILHKEKLHLRALRGHKIKQNNVSILLHCNNKLNGEETVVVGQVSRLLGITKLLEIQVFKDNNVTNQKAKYNRLINR